MKRKIIALLLACTMLVSTGCSANVAMDENGKVTVDGVSIEELAKEFGVALGEEETADEAATEETDEEEASVETGGGSPWIDADLKSNIKEDMDLSAKDDFYLYVNHDWLLKAELPEGKSSKSAFSEVNDIVNDKALKVLGDDTLKGHDAELIQSFYKAILDWDSRDKAGLDPIMKKVKDIQGLSSLDEVSDFITDPDRCRLVSTFAAVGNIPSFNDSMSYIVAIAHDDFTLEDAAEYKERTELGDRNYEGKLYLAKAMLTRLDYSEDEAKEMFDTMLDLEGKIAEVAFTSADRMSPEYFSKINNEYKPDEIKDFSKSFPLNDIIKNNGFEEAEKFLILEPAALDKLNEIYTEDNLEAIKDYMLVRFLLDSAEMLDSEAYDAYVESQNIMTGSTGRKKDEIVAFDTVRKALPAPMDRAYLERYDNTEQKKKITKICEDVIDVYRDMLEGVDWLSEETRAQAIEKLDAITINALYPDKWKDYSDLDLKDKSYFDCVNEITKFNEKYDLSHLNGKVDREIWDFDILEPNAYYNPQDNSINIILGLMDEPFYYDGMSDEELLGGVGSVIGHEISHAFDTSGSQYDKNGDLADWWQDEDYKAFKERADKLIDYYDNISVWKGQNAIGKNVQTEAIADMTGMKAILKIAESKKDFDYDKFFRAYATIWERINSYEFEYYCLTQDTHPLHFLRANVTLQQFDEFFDTYDIKEGDNMYLAPEDRIVVW